MKKIGKEGAISRHTETHLVNYVGAIFEQELPKKVKEGLSNNLVKELQEMVREQHLHLPLFLLLLQLVNPSDLLSWSWQIVVLLNQVTKFH
jgi:hypothetical protein